MVLENTVSNLGKTFWVEKICDSLFLQTLVQSQRVCMVLENTVSNLQVTETIGEFCTVADKYKSP